MRAFLAGLTLALVAVMAPNAQAQESKDKNEARDTAKREARDTAKREDRDTAKREARDTGKREARDAGKRETVRGVIAGVTVAGETAIDFATHRAATVETTYLSIVGSPAWDARTRTSPARDADGGRHNVYVLSIGPRTEVRNSTALGRGQNEDIQGDNPALRGKPARIDDLQIGDRVRVAFDRREFASTGSGDNPQARKHGRDRTYFGDARSIDILSEPDRDRDRRDAAENGRDRDRDDDKDKVNDRSKANDRDNNDRSRANDRDNKDRPAAKGEKDKSS